MPGALIDRRGREPLFCRKDVHVDQHGRLSPTIFGPVGDIRALDPLFAGLVHDLPQTVTVLGILPVQQICHHRPLGMAVIADYRAGLQDNRPYAERVAFQRRYLRRIFFLAASRSALSCSKSL